jgi:serine/threonine protein kinase
VSPLAADLISRMLQANPCRRLRIADIKLHPWLRQTVPVYARLPYFSHALTEVRSSLDLQVLAQLRTLGMESLKNAGDEERIGKIIRKRMDDSFVAVYELIKDEKERNLQLCPLKDSPGLQIFHRVPNKLKRPTLEDEQQFVYGHAFALSAR